MKNRTESERDVYKAAIDEMADNVAAVWQSGPGPKDGSWILGMFNAAPYVVYWDSWETGETIPGEGAYPEGHESGWVLARDNVVVMDEDEPTQWARIIPPDRKQPAPWEKEIFGGADGTP